MSPLPISRDLDQDDVWLAIAQRKGSSYMTLLVAGKKGDVENCLAQNWHGQTPMARCVVEKRRFLCFDF